MLKRPHPRCNSALLLAGSYLLVLFACDPVRAFLIPVHVEITKTALEQPVLKSSLSDWDRKQIVRGCNDGDIGHGGLPFTGGPYQEWIHFDNQFSYDAVLNNYGIVAGLIDRNLAKKDRDPWEYGNLLHAIQDFYAHSNYVWIYTDYPAQTHQKFVSVPTFESVLLAPSSTKELMAMLKRDLRTGRYPFPKLRIPNDGDHGHFFAGAGMNKDAIGRAMYVEARQAAMQAASWYLKLYVRDKDTHNNGDG